MRIQCLWKYKIDWILVENYCLQFKTSNYLRAVEIVISEILYQIGMWKHYNTMSQEIITLPICLRYQMGLLQPFSYKLVTLVVMSLMWVKIEKNNGLLQQSSKDNINVQVTQQSQRLPLTPILICIITNCSYYSILFFTTYCSTMCFVNVVLQLILLLSFMC